MDIVKIAALGVVAAFAVVVVKQLKPEFAPVLGVVAAVLIVANVLDELFDVMFAFYDLANASGVEKSSVFSVVKIIGIGYICEFSNNVCKDANCSDIGDKVLFAGKIAILLVALPIVKNIFEVVCSILP